VRKTKLHNLHVNLGARIVEFAGWSMPVYYSGIVEEHRGVREAVGLFDVSHMGEIEIRGPGHLVYANALLSNDVSKLEIGQAQYTVMLHEDGGIVDDLLAYRFADRIMLVVNAANTEKDVRWVTEHQPSDVEVEDLSHEITQLALQGPMSDRILSRVTDIPLDELKYYWFREAEVAGVSAVVSRTGYTGERGFEVYLRVGSETAERVWTTLQEAGRAEGLVPVGLGARDTLRLEMGYCLYGNDISAETNPLEAGLGWITKLKKGPFVGREALLRAKELGISRRLFGLEMTGREIPRPGYAIHDGDREIGRVTSGAYGPSVGKGIALGYLRKDVAVEGIDVDVLVRGKRARARTVKPPFHRQATLT
jgi:aminomethyltransferase